MRRRRERRRRLVLLCDISGSMEPYTRAFLQLLVAAVGGADAEAFVFATRLTRLTSALRSRQPDLAIDRAAAAARDWSSGTRIGESLQRFNDEYGRRGMARGAVVVVICLMAGSGAIRPSSGGRWPACAGWLSGSCGSTRVRPRGAFAPLAGGMSAALPYATRSSVGITFDPDRGRRGDRGWIEAGQSFPLGARGSPVKFENAFDVQAPADQVWNTLMDVGRVAPCMPGAEVLEDLGDDRYRVGIKVKVGPISMLYRGEVEIVERDDASQRAVMRARAREARGQGTADAHVHMSLSEQAPSTHATLETDLQLSGRAAAMGRGVIGDVASKLIERFATNLAAMLAEGQAAAAAARAAAPTVTHPVAAPPAPPVPGVPMEPAEPVEEVPAVEAAPPAPAERQRRGESQAPAETPPTPAETPAAEEPTQPVVPPEPAAPPEPVEPPAPVEPIEAIEPVVPPEPVEPVEPVEPEPVAPPEPAAPPEPEPEPAGLIKPWSEPSEAASGETPPGPPEPPPAPEVPPAPEPVAAEPEPVANLPEPPEPPVPVELPRARHRGPAAGGGAARATGRAHRAARSAARGPGAAGCATGARARRAPGASGRAGGGPRAGAGDSGGGGRGARATAAPARPAAGGAGAATAATATGTAAGACPGARGVAAGGRDRAQHPVGPAQAAADAGGAGRSRRAYRAPADLAPTLSGPRRGQRRLRRVRFAEAAVVRAWRGKPRLRRETRAEVDVIRGPRSGAACPWSDDPRAPRGPGAPRQRIPMADADVQSPRGDQLE